MLDIEAMKAENAERRRRKEAATPPKWKAIKPGHGQKSKYLCVQFGSDENYGQLSS